MKHYNLLPSGGGAWWKNKELVDSCGSLYPYITKKSCAIEYAKNVKERFPEFEFELTEGETWGSQTLVLTL